MDTARRSWAVWGASGLARPVVVATAVGLLIVLAANILLAFITPAAVPSYDFTTVSALAPVVPFTAVAIIGLLLVVRRPGNPMGWLLSALIVTFGVNGITSSYLQWTLYTGDPLPGLAVPLGLFGLLVGALTTLPLILMPLLFPDGHLASRRWRPVVWLALGVAVVSMAGSLLDPNALGDGHRRLVNPFGVTLHLNSFLSGALNAATLISWVLLMALAIASLVVRFRRSEAEVREQIKWFGAGMTVLVLGIITGALANPNSNSAWTTPVPIAAEIVAFTALPVAIAIAIMKYHLYDIDVVISRALVYGSLAVLITLVYVAIVVGVGTLIGQGGRPNLALAVVATGVVAVGFQPVRERLTRLANRLVYGKRATPYEVLSDFSRRVAETYAAEDVLPRMAQVLGEGTGAEQATVWLRTGSWLRPAATYPDGGGEREPVAVTGQLLPHLPAAARAMPVRHQGELLGALAVAKRAGESLTPMEEKLLEDLATQAGLVLKNVGLTADLAARLDELKASRQRLVAAQDDERRRLERNLHDGAQQNLVALKVKLNLARRLIDSSPPKAREMLEQLKGETDETLETLRDLARGIYPPLLADRGLPAALEAQARKATLPVTVDADGVGRYPLELEGAVYFCCLEALQNVQKYAGASSARVRLREADGRLLFEVEDDGKGFDPAVTPRGAGLGNMADRLDALGGTFTVRSNPGQGTRLMGTVKVEPMAGPVAAAPTPAELL